ncbi:bifunctional hydroxymethylpyrimidine kinase/phosphomethylpyrimidine kinase [Komagataeibacter swingsii]|uniref:hydroxymethylpyrimidine kinase n=1 Tax=Komagataeibacter swingsii TaxID=215220 RepID=A0A850P039_9PROT|nr:bifunctional hydroxymethylpyrimidine kinase/phosphomethylpyrimidine kinase [Komagataeibacter swingsii]AHI26519.1 phosphomethylpyrimidine kinase [Komagataeibacter xylinus E25]NVN36159.1 bifunctional hydroxymethylpyrimidine kinase/phosphomethylpyrimidine kinase [Komagataeibacter swingsii]RFP06224.1 bifunctional hydroxymethylpyrimidine kinase/phosphomethylpyrimidine kinase [Komagataeibacter xylinus]RFP06482.1 bifunctional hydroxymethylpyrimidine kinase/phosphomethylpyrimidine kinase [Komagataei
MRGRILIMAGSDSGGGAGIQADIKTVTMLGGFAMTAVTALTAQNTLGVQDVMPVPPAFVIAQMRCVMDDLGVDAFKSGMLDRPEVIGAIASVLMTSTGIPYVLDPVMVAKGGAALLQDSALSTLKSRLLPLASVLTPNLPEAAALLGRRIGGRADMIAAAHDLLALGPRAVLLKGGHMEGDELVDVLLERGGVAEEFVTRRIHTRHTHGTGCTLASAIATGLGQGMPLRDAVVRARAYVHEAIARAPGYGAGAGPLDHTAGMAMWGS